MARTLDAFVAENPDMLVVVANGNEGPNAGTVLTPATAKNIVAVGALSGANDVASFSSLGPTKDGRIKPTLVAPGTAVVSASADVACGEVSKSGTSMAAPIVAGGAALVRQYFTEGFYPSGTRRAEDALTPSASLLKAVLLAGAEAVGGGNTQGPIPAMGQGFGRVNLDHALYFAGDATGLFVKDDRAGLEQGQAAVLTVDVEAGSDLKVALTWSDPPPGPGAGSVLVNDLNLTVSGPAGSFKGNFLQNGQSAPGGGFDSVNVEELVLIAAAPAGRYTITVSGPNIPLGPQP